jgi:hypothetical protein
MAKTYSASLLSVYDENGNKTSIPALKGDDYVLTAADKQEIANNVYDKFSTETWTFTLENGSTVTKTVVLK